MKYDYEYDQYDRMMRLSDGRRAVRIPAGFDSEMLYGYVDSEENMAIPPKWTEAGNFHDGLAPVCDEGDWGNIDVEGNYVIGLQYVMANEFRNGVAWVCSDDGWQLINTKGHVISKTFKGWLAGPGTEDYTLFYCRDTNKSYFADRQGNFFEVADGEVRDLDYRTVIIQDGKCGVKNFKGEWLISPIYDNIQILPWGNILVEKDGKWGRVDENQKLCSPIKYDDIDTGHGFGGIYPVKVGDKSGFLLDNGEELFDCIFDEVWPFVEGKALVRIGENRFMLTDYGVLETPHYYGLIDADGNWIVKPRFREVGYIRDGIFPATEFRRWGLFNTKGEEIIPQIYRFIDPDFSEGFAKAYLDKDGKTIEGVLDIEGNFYPGENPYDMHEKARKSHVTAMAKFEAFVYGPKLDAKIRSRFGSDITVINGSARVCYKGRTGFINTDGTWAIPPIFHDIKSASRESVMFASI